MSSSKMSSPFLNLTSYFFCLSLSHLINKSPNQKCRKKLKGLLSRSGFLCFMNSYLLNCDFYLLLCFKTIPKLSKLEAWHYMIRYRRLLIWRISLAESVMQKCFGVLSER